MNDEPLFPVLVTGLHCGTVAYERKVRHRDELFPVLVTGLHCGDAQFAQIERVLTLFPVLVTGLHCGGPNVFDVPSGASPLPGPRDRAPLRPAWPRRPLPRLRLFPVLVTGLHCGYLPLQYGVTVG